jgi:hypothetical protein
MAINNFTSAGIADDGALVLNGESKDAQGHGLGAGATIKATVISVEPPAKRCDGVVSNPESPEWQATIPAGHGFAALDDVYVIGKASGGTPLVWANELVVDAPNVKK